MADIKIGREVFRGVNSIKVYDTNDNAVLFVSEENVPQKIILAEFAKIRSTDMTSMFQNCTSLTTLDLSAFDTSAVTNMDSMFRNCNSLTTLDLSSFDTSAVTNMDSMFRNCNSLTTLDLSIFDTSAVINMNNMFDGCRALTTVDLSSFGTSAVTNMLAMFGNCTSLTTLDLSSFDTSAVTNMDYMFTSCTALTDLTLGSTWHLDLNFQWSPLTPESMISVITHLKDYSGTDEADTKTVTFRDDCWAALEAHSTAPGGGTWEAYTNALGWLT